MVRVNSTGNIVLFLFLESGCYYLINQNRYLNFLLSKNITCLIKRITAPHLAKGAVRCWVPCILPGQWHGGEMLRAKKEKIPQKVVSCVYK